MKTFFFIGIGNSFSDFFNVCQSKFVSNEFDGEEEETKKCRGRQNWIENNEWIKNNREGAEMKLDF